MWRLLPGVPRVAHKPTQSMAASALTWTLMNSWRGSNASWRCVCVCHSSVIEHGCQKHSMCNVQCLHVLLNAVGDAFPGVTPLPSCSQLLQEITCPCSHVCLSMRITQRLCFWHHCQVCKVSVSCNACCFVLVSKHTHPSSIGRAGSICACCMSQDKQSKRTLHEQQMWSKLGTLI